MPRTPERPGNSRGLMPLRPSHQKVLASPSKDTEASVKRMNSTPLGGSAPCPSRAAPGIASDNRRLVSSSGDDGIQTRGDSKPIKRKKMLNGSARPSQAASPNSMRATKVNSQ